MSSKRLWMQWVGRGLALFLTVLPVGCAGTQLVGGGPYGAQPAPSAGAVRYALAKSVISVEVTVTKQANGKVKLTRVDDVGDFSVDSEPKWKESKAKVSVLTAADDTQFFTLKLELGDASEDNLTVKTTPGGLLKSVEVGSISQAGAIVKSTVTFVASVAAVVAGAVLGPNELSDQVVGANVVCKRFSADAGCTLHERATLSRLPLAALYFLAEKDAVAARRNWRRQRELEARVEHLRKERITVEDSIAKAGKPEVEVLKIKLGLITDALNTTRQELKTLTDAVDESFKTFQKKKKIDPESHQEDLRLTFDLNEIPPPGEFADSPIGELEPSAARKVLAAKPAYARMLAFYDAAGIFLTLTERPQIVSALESPPAGDPSTPEGRIFYRQAHFATLSTYVKQVVADKGGEEKQVIRLTAATLEELVDPRAPALAITFEPKSFAQRKMSIEFDDRGRLVTVQQSGSSALAGATSAVADGFASARDAYAGTLSKIAEVQDTQRKIADSEILTEIDKLKKQKELLDARLDLSGTESSYDLLLEKKQLDAQLAALQGRAAVSAAGDRAEIDRLKAQVDLLNQEIAIIKARQELDQMNRLKSP